MKTAIVLAVVSTMGCAADRAVMRELPAVARQAAAPAAAPVVADLFQRDTAGSISEADLRALLDAPVALEPGARVGVVSVVDRYDPDGATPLAPATGALANALADTGAFDMVSEVSTDFSATTSVSGLRELAARYRADYLVLYRHRFVERARPTPWLVRSTFETEAVLEATLFDVRSGTILFTVFRRAKESHDDMGFDAERVQREARDHIVDVTARALCGDVILQVRRLSGEAVASSEAAAPASS